jgi:hypothetical protein
MPVKFMSAKFALSLLAGLTLCSLPIVSSSASANSWHSPSVYEESNGEYTNYSYDDGLCQYRYSYNRYEKHVQANRSGDCDHLLIGPDGRVMGSVDDDE